MTQPTDQEPKKAPLGVGGWLTIVVLGVFLGLAIWFAFYGWNLTDAAPTLERSISDRPAGPTCVVRGTTGFWP